MRKNKEQKIYQKKLKKMLRNGGIYLTTLSIAFALGRYSVKDDSDFLEIPQPAGKEITIELPPKEDDTLEYEDVTYKIEQGDTLESIANRFDTSTEIIMNANPNINKNNIYVGSILIIPNVEKELAKSYYEEDIKRVKVDYTIKEGDNLESIAQKFEVSKEEIIKENNIEDENTIYVGEHITIPNVSILIYEYIQIEQKAINETLEAKNLPEGYTRVIDISEMNSQINWDLLEEEFKKETFTHVILRINENIIPGTTTRQFTVDNQFEKNLSECNKRNIPYGVYSFSRGSTPEEINTETNCLINYINDNLNKIKEVNGETLDLTFNLSLPLYMDCFEDNAMSQFQLYLDGKYDYCAELVKLWCNNMESAGYFTGVYCMNSAYQAIGNERLSEFTLWIADYGNEIYDDVKNVGLNGEVELNSLIKGQQVTSKGSINGINGYVDVSVFDEDLPQIVKAYYQNSNKTRS